MKKTVRTMIPTATGFVVYDREVHRTELTAREREVWALVGSGKCNKEIERALGISLGTVKTHLHSVFRLTGSRDRTQAAIAYVKQSLVAE